MKEIKDFNDIDIRVGTIIKAEEFIEARKDSYKITIDFGLLGFYKTSAQITFNYSKEDLVGKQIISVVNLGYKRIAGFKSQCLILGVVSNKAITLICPKEFVPNGTSILW